MKKGSDPRRSLYYLDQAVDLNDYDETAFVARSRSVNYRFLVRGYLLLADVIFILDKILRQ